VGHERAAPRARGDRSADRDQHRGHEHGAARCERARSGRWTWSSSTRRSGGASGPPVLPSVPFAADAHYHHLVDDVIEGGKLPYRHGTIAVPQGPGLGIRLDRERPPGTPGCTRSWATTRTTRTPAGPAGTPGCPTRSGRIRTPPRRWDGRPAGRPATRAPEAGRDRGNGRGRGRHGPFRPDGDRAGAGQPVGIHAAPRAHRPRAHDPSGDESQPIRAHAFPSR